MSVPHDHFVVLFQSADADRLLLCLEVENELKIAGAMSRNPRCNLLHLSSEHVVTGKQCQLVDCLWSKKEVIPKEGFWTTYDSARQQCYETITWFTSRVSVRTVQI